MLHKFIIYAIVLCCAGLLPLQVSYAQLPAGSYQASCSDCTVQDNQLTCQCKNRSGTKVSTSIEYTACTGNSIWNENGVLKCYSVPTESMPQGSYRQTCGSCDDSGSKLTCHCRKRDGNWISSSVWYLPCAENSVSNDNGALKCSLRGTAWQTCRNVQVGSARVSAECRKSNGTWATSSISTTCDGGFSNCNGTLTCGECP
jgi:hypothetical protein